MAERLDKGEVFLMRSSCADYIRSTADDKAYYEIFFQMCRKFHINWATATDKEKAFITEVTRVTYERSRAVQSGTSPDDIRPAFSA